MKRLKSFLSLNPKVKYLIQTKPEFVPDKSFQLILHCENCSFYCAYLTKKQAGRLIQDNKIIAIEESRTNVLSH